MPNIISTLPYTITNGTVGDASQVQADLAQIVSNVNANAAENGANASITSISGLTAALSIAQGGTGQTAAASALTALGGLSTSAAVSGYQPLDATLTGIAALSTAANNILVGSGADTFSVLNFDVDGTLAANSDVNIASQKATKTAIAAASIQIKSLTASVASNQLTVNSTATIMDFRSATLANGSAITGVSVPALTITIPTLATLGTVNASQSQLVLLVAYNYGTPVLCITNITGGLNLDETTLISPTTISAAATANNVIYSASAVAANSPFRVIGYINITEATAGTWVTAPSLVQGEGGQALAYVTGLSPGVLLKTELLTSGTSVAGPTGWTVADTICIGGGGGGAASSGGGGSWSRKRITGSGGSLSYVIGAGGAGGNNGGATSISGNQTAGGGIGGSVGGTASGGDINLSGAGGGSGYNTAGGTPIYNNNAGYGAGGGISTNGVQGCILITWYK